MLRVEPMTVQMTTRIVVEQDVLSAHVGDETVLLSIAEGDYYAVDGAADRIWQLVHEEITVSDIVAAIADEFDVDEAGCRDDVVGFVSDLADKGLVRVLG